MKMNQLHLRMIRKDYDTTRPFLLFLPVPWSANFPEELKEKNDAFEGRGLCRINFGVLSVVVLIEKLNDEIVFYLPNDFDNSKIDDLSYRTLLGMSPADWHDLIANWTKAKQL